MGKVKVLAGLFAVIFVIAINGCMSRDIKPVPQLITPDQALKIDISNAVAVRGETRTPDEKILVCDVIQASFGANQNDLINISTAVLEDALVKSNIQVDENAEKSLTVTLVEAHCEATDHFFYMTFTEFVKLKIKAGDNIIKEFEGTQTTGSLAAITYIVEMGITNAVVEMLKDPDIIEYLKN